MIVTIDPSTFIISIAKSELTLIQATPTEIYSMSLNYFRLALKDWEDDGVDGGITFSITHNHNTEVTLGGLTYARIIEVLEPYTITFEDGQYAVNLFGANSNVGDRVNVNQVSVRSNNSAGLITSAAIEYGEYDGGVTIDVNSTYTGVVYPVGTARQPVNNLADAVFIAELRGFNKLFFISDFTFPNGTVINDLELYGQGLQTTTFTFETGCSLTDCKIFDAIAVGFETGITGFENCEIRALEDTGLIASSTDIIIINCLIESIVTLANNYTGTLKILDSYSNIAGFGTPILNMADAQCDIMIRNWAGGIKLTNSSHATNDISLDTVSGRLTLDDTVTYGNVACGGVGILKDSNGDPINTGIWNTNVNIHADSLMAKATIANAVSEEIGDEIQYSAYNNGVTIDVNAAYTYVDTEYPFGTPAQPVNNLDDALLIAEERGFTKLYFISDWTFPNGTYITGYELYGKGIQTTTFTFEAGCILALCKVSNTKITGSETGIIGFNNVLLEDLGSIGLAPSSIDIIANKCFFKGTLSIPDNYSGTMSAIDCFALPDASILPPVIDMNGGAFNIQARNFSGFLNIKNCTQPTNTIAIMLNSGGIILDSTVTDGTLIFTGIGNLTDRSTGGKIDSKGLVQGKIIDDTIHAVEALRPYHTGFGKTIYWNPVNGNDAYDGTAPSLATLTFSAAHDLAKDGGHDVIVALSDDVANTIVDEVITISKNYLFLRGPGRDFTIKPTSTTSPTVTIDAFGVEISGMIINTADTGSQNAIEIVSDANFFLIENVWFHNSTNTSIHVTGSVAYGRINGCFISNSASYGIHLNGDISYTKIENTEIDSTGSDGILIEGITATNNIIGAGVKIYSAGGYGINIVSPTTRTFIDFNASMYDNASGKILDNGIDTVYGESDVATAVWDQDLSNHVSSGTSGKVLSSLSYDGRVWIDSANGSSGTEYPIGTKGNPVNNASDAAAILGITALNIAHIEGDLISEAAISNITIEGTSYLTSRLHLNNFLYTDMLMQDIELDGILNATNILMNRCYLNGTKNISNEIRNCIGSGEITIKAGANLIGTGFSSNSAIIDMQNQVCSVSLEVINGDITFKNVITGSLINLNLKGSDIFLDASITGGDLSINGIGNIHGDPDALGMTVIENHLISTEVITDKVWDEPIIDHLIAGSTGNKLNTASSGGVDYDTLANAVWSEDLTTYATTGTAGNIMNNLPDDMQTTLYKILGLVQHNFRMTSQTYNTKGNLTSSNIKIYENAADCNSGTNEIGEYLVNVIYASDGIKVNDYKVIEA